MTLDALLTEVGPILASSQFSHPSFQEVLAAQHIADDINSARMSVRQAACSLWLYDPHEDFMAAQDAACNYSDDLPRGCEFEPRGLRSEWSHILAHVAGMLEKEKASELVDIVAEFHSEAIERIQKHRWESFRRENFAVVKDLSFCAQVIGAHSSLHSEDRASQVMDVLMEVLYKSGRRKRPFEYVPDPCYGLAKDALTRTRSDYAAGKLLEYNIFLDHLPVSDFLSPAEKEDLRVGASSALRSIVENGARISEDFLVKCMESLKEIRYRDIDLLLDFGKDTSFRQVLGMLAGGFVLPSFDSGKPGDFFGLTLLGIKKYGFEPRLISYFNSMVSKISSDEIMNDYRAALSSFAKLFEPMTGKKLHAHLEAKGIQFFGSEVYKPK